CPYDYLRILDGNRKDAQEIGKFCGSYNSSTLVFSSSETLRMEFSTGEGRQENSIDVRADFKYERRGFNLSYEFSDSFVRLDSNYILNGSEHVLGTECDLRILSYKESHGTIVSPGYPGEARGVVCHYYLDGLMDDQNLEKVKISFTNFNIPGNIPYCLLGYLEEVDDIRISEPLKRNRFCGSLNPPPIYSQVPRMVLVFNISKEIVGKFTASYHFITDYGIKGQQIEEGKCKFHYKSSIISGEVNSPRHPGSYPPNLDCEYIFRPFHDEVVVISFTVFNVSEHDSPHCITGDYVAFYEDLGSISREDFTLTETYCGKALPGPYATTRLLKMVFHSDERNGFIGFKANYRFLPKKNITTSCPVIDSFTGGRVIGGGGKGGTIESPGFPAKYTKLSWCEWIIHASRKENKILVEIPELNLEGTYSRGPERASCEMAVLKLYNDSTSNRPVAATCGVKKSNDGSPSYLSAHDSFKISFLSSSSSLGGRGFKISWTEVHAVNSLSGDCSGFQCAKNKYCISPTLKCNKEPNCGQGDESDEVAECPKTSGIQILHIAIGTSISSFFCIILLICGFYHRRKFRSDRAPPDHDHVEVRYVSAPTGCNTTDRLLMEDRHDGSNDHHNHSTTQSPRCQKVSMNIKGIICIVTIDLSVLSVNIQLMSNKNKKRLNAVTVSSNGSERNGLSEKSITRTEGEITKMKNRQHSLKSNSTDLENKSWPLLSALNIIFGLVAMLAVSYANVALSYETHENNLWFSNIKEVEREISFRTESGLYYSYYKKLVHSPSLLQGIKELTEDKFTEHPDTINILARMNIYQEAILAVLYRTFNIKMAPIMFYINFVFYLHGLLITGLFLMTWFLSNSWLAGLLSAAFYIFNRNDTNRVSGAIPLRECFSLPFLWVQAAALTLYFKPGLTQFVQRSSLTVVAISTFFFCLFWQFNQFIMMLQAFALFGVWVLGLISAHKVKNVMLCQLVSLVLVCLLQFGNKMIVGSLAFSFIVVSLIMLSLVKAPDQARSLCDNILKVIGLSLVSLVLMFVLSTIIKVIIKVDADEHIFSFLTDKFAQRIPRNFDSRLYLCLDMFGFITHDVFVRLTENLVLPLYVPSHLFLLILLIYTVVSKWRLPKVKEHSRDENKVEEKTSQYYYDKHPDVAFHTIQAVFFGALAIMTLRMRYFWTPYICVLASVGIGNEDLWSIIITFTRTSHKHLGIILQAALVRSAVLVLTISILTGKLLPGIMKELEGKYEFWDPDTVELMDWIVANTEPTDSFTGSMQLLAGVKLCTLRPITNHPHYEDKYLRKKTKQLYQIYGKQQPEHVHKILTKYKSNYIILEDSICRAPSKDGCRLPDLIDIDNGVMPDNYFKMPDLIKSKIPRFCEMVRHQTEEYAKYFKAVFENKTFRVYKVNSDKS
ncbi:hypothetical protein Btru_039781, partial [Bulinus truncatus]